MPLHRERLKQWQICLAFFVLTSPPPSILAPSLQIFRVCNKLEDIEKSAL